MNDIGVSNHAIRDVDGEVVGTIAASPLRYEGKAPASIIRRPRFGWAESADQERRGKNGCWRLFHGPDPARGRNGVFGRSN